MVRHGWGVWGETGELGSGEGLVEVAHGDGECVYTDRYTGRMLWRSSLIRPARAPALGQLLRRSSSFLLPDSLWYTDALLAVLLLAFLDINNGILSQEAGALPSNAGMTSTPLYIAIGIPT